MEFKLKQEVSIADRYLNDEVGIIANATKNARILSLPSDDEELVMVQYENKIIDYVPQDIIEPPIFHIFENDTHTFIISEVLTKSEIKELGLDENEKWLMNEVGFQFPKDSNSWDKDCFNVITDDDNGNGDVQLFDLDKLPKRFIPTLEKIKELRNNHFNFFTWDYDSSEGITDKKVIIRKVNERDLEENYYDNMEQIFSQLIKEGVTDIKIRI